jgi:hypothetical protein
VNRHIRLPRRPHWPHVSTHLPWRMPQRKPRQAPAAGQDSTTVKVADWAVLGITLFTTVAALALSYRNQFDFASGPGGGYPVWGAILFPLLIDSFVVVGEIRLFSATIRADGWRIKTWAWLLTVIGLAASAAANVAHVGLDGPASVKLAAAVAPLAAAASLGTGLGIVKLNARARKTGATAAVTATVPAAASRPATAPARQPGRARKTRRTGPAAEQLAAWIADDRLAGLDMTRRKFAARHGISDHHARTALAAASNGHQELAEAPA